MSANPGMDANSPPADYFVDQEHLKMYILFPLKAKLKVLLSVSHWASQAGLTGKLRLFQWLNFSSEPAASPVVV